MSEDRANPYIPGLEHQITYENIYFSDLPTMIRLLEQFQLAHMRGWKKDDEDITPEGTEFLLQLSHRETRRFEVKPGNMWSRSSAGGRAFGDGPIMAIANIPYELTCKFTVRKGERHRISLTMLVDEKIDPGGSVTEYPLGSAWIAPSYLYTEGFFGKELDKFLASRLWPR